MKRNVILHFEVNNGKLTTRIEGDAAALCAGLDCLICTVADEINMDCLELVEMIHCGMSETI